MTAKLLAFIDPCTTCQSTNILTVQSKDKSIEYINK